MFGQRCTRTKRNILPYGYPLCFFSLLSSCQTPTNDENLFCVILSFICVIIYNDENIFCVAFLIPGLFSFNKLKLVWTSS